MTTYDPKAVTELLDALEEAKAMLGVSSRVNEALAALKPKPEKHYVLPEWREFVKTHCQKTHLDGVTSFQMPRPDGAFVWVDMSPYLAIREATATDKPQGRLPDEPSNEDTEKFRMLANPTSQEFWFVLCRKYHAHLKKTYNV